MHALREMVRVLKPDGRLLDLRPIGGLAPVDIMSDGRAETVFEIDGSPGDADDRASNAALQKLVDEGLLVETAREVFRYRHYWDTVDEMHEEIAKTWSQRNVIPDSQDLNPARRAHKAAGPTATVRVSRKMRLCGYRLNGM